MTPDRLDDLAAATVHGRADAAELAALAAWIGGDRRRAAAWLGAVRRARFLHRHWAAADGALPMTRPWRWTAAAGIAAAALLVVGILALVAGTGPSADGQGSASPDPRIARSPDGAAWPPGSRIALPATAALALRWPDGCRIDLAGAEARVGDGEPRMHLAAGRLRAEVEPRSASLAIATPAGTVEVIGTAFTVAVGDAAVDVAVEHGRVRWRSGARERILAAGATRAEPRERLGWRWETISDRPTLRETIGVLLPPRPNPGGRIEPGDSGRPVLEVGRPAGGGAGFTNVAAPWTGDGPIIALRVVDHGPRSDLNLIAVEADGDGWLVAHRPLTATGAMLITWEDPDPDALRFRNGDGRWDPAQMERLVVSLWGDPATVLLPSP